MSIRVHGLRCRFWQRDARHWFKDVGVWAHREMEMGARGTDGALASGDKRVAEAFRLLQLAFNPAAHFSPSDDAEYSATRGEFYSSCPLQFLLYVLRLFTEVSCGTVVGTVA